MTLRCPVCGNGDANRRFEAREMQFGTREVFHYGECRSCGCLWLLDAPEDMGRYYRNGYYSFRRSKIREWVRQQPSLYRLAHLLRARRFPPGLPAWWPQRPARLDSSVLDVGSGAGNFLLHLKYVGFTRLTGVDPFLESDILYPGGPRILKRSLSQVDERFDVVVLNHSLEHMAEPHAVFQEISRVVEPDGQVVIRTPAASSYAYRKYGSNWVQLDAPRHVVIHTPTGIASLAKDANLHVVSITYDSTGFQVWGSEQYLRDIPLTSPRSYQISPRASIFSREQLTGYEALAQRLNESKQGDQICVVLTPKAGELLHQSC